MPKAAAPGQIDIPGVGPFSASAVPDPFDDRDLIYRPMLDLLPTTIDQRQGRRPRHVYLQEGESCTGHAVAAVINHVLSATTPGARVSPYMLYHLARRSPHPSRGTQCRVGLPGGDAGRVQGRRPRRPDPHLAGTGDLRREVPGPGAPSPRSQGTVERFTCFNLSDALELADAVEPVYHKSAVYLVARGFEEDLGGRVAEVPILGLEKYWQESFAGGRSLRDEVSDRGGELIVARSAAPAHSRTNARRHGDFDEDQPTMTSVLMRVLGVTRTPRKYEYQSNAKLLDPESVPWPRRGGAMAPVRGAPVIAPGVPAPVLRMAAGPAAAAADQVASRSGSPILDMIDATSWKAGDE